MNKIIASAEQEEVLEVIGGRGKEQEQVLVEENGQFETSGISDKTSGVVDGILPDNNVETKIFTADKIKTKQELSQKKEDVLIRYWRKILRQNKNSIIINFLRRHFIYLSEENKNLLIKNANNNALKIIIRGHLNELSGNNFRTFLELKDEEIAEFIAEYMDTLSDIKFIELLKYGPEYISEFVVIYLSFLPDKKVKIFLDYVDNDIIKIIVDIYFGNLSEENKNILMKKTTPDVLVIIAQKHFVRLSEKNIDLLIMLGDSEVHKFIVLMHFYKLYKKNTETLIEYGDNDILELIVVTYLLFDLPEKALKKLLKKDDKKINKYIFEYINNSSDEELERLLQNGGVYIYQFILKNFPDSPKILQIKDYFERLDNDEFKRQFEELSIRDKIIFITNFVNIEARYINRILAKLKIILDRSNK